VGKRAKNWLWSGVTGDISIPSPGELLLPSAPLPLFIGNTVPIRLLKDTDHSMASIKSSCLPWCFEQRHLTELAGFHLLCASGEQVSFMRGTYEEFLGRGEYASTYPTYYNKARDRTDNSTSPSHLPAGDTRMETGELRQVPSLKAQSHI
jgi:hypothetical protein